MSKRKRCFFLFCFCFVYIYLCLLQYGFHTNRQTIQLLELMQQQWQRNSIVSSFRRRTFDTTYRIEYRLITNTQLSYTNTNIVLPPHTRPLPSSHPPITKSHIIILTINHEKKGTKLIYTCSCAWWAAAGLAGQQPQAHRDV